MTRVLVDQDIKPVSAIRSGLPDSWEISVGIDTSPEALHDAFTRADMLLITSRIKVTRELLVTEPRVSLIGKLGTGVDNIDLATATEVGIPVTYTPGYNALSVAELGLGLILATARRFTEARSVIEAGRWRDSFTLGTRISGSTVGLIGFGDVGKRLAGLLSGFNVDLLYADPYIRPIDGEPFGAQPKPLEELLQESDVVCLMPELTPETEGLIGPHELSLMSPDTLLVNISRGPVVNESALLDALERDSLGGVGLDVFTDEPLAQSSALLDHKSVIVTPHIGAMTREDRNKSIEQLTTNIRALRRGDQISDEFIAHPVGSD